MGLTLKLALPCQSLLRRTARQHAWNACLHRPAWAFTGRCAPAAVACHAQCACISYVHLVVLQPESSGGTVGNRVHSFVLSLLSAVAIKGGWAATGTGLHRHLSKHKLVLQRVSKRRCMGLTFAPAGAGANQRGLESTFATSGGWSQPLLH